MRRRAFIALIGAMAWPHAARAQQAALPTIGFLHSASPDPRSSYASAVAAFRKGLGEGTLTEGTHVALEFRWAEDRFDRLPELASDLVQRDVSLIFAGGGDVVALAAKRATSTIPIVFAIGADPVAQGIVASLSRPGANITGVSFLSVELRPKMVELFRELVPAGASIAVLANPNRPGFERLVAEVVEPAQRAGLRVHVRRAGNEGEITAAFATFETTRVDALLVLSDPVYLNRRVQIAELQAAHRIPTIHASRESVLAGGVASYGASIEEATKFELVLNLKSAKSLGLDIPPLLLARADEVIE
jgi:putative tryptophan/tyrosine transport system substrate-binding protein